MCHKGHFYFNLSDKRLAKLSTNSSETSPFKSDLAAPIAHVFHGSLNLPTFICLYQERRRVCSSVPFPGRPSAAVWGSSRSSSHWVATASCCSSPHLQVCLTPQHRESTTRCTEARQKLPRAWGSSASLLSAAAHKGREIYSIFDQQQGRFPPKQQKNIKILCQSLWLVTYFNNPLNNCWNRPK